MRKNKKKPLREEPVRKRKKPKPCRGAKIPAPERDNPYIWPEQAKIADEIIYHYWRANGHLPPEYVPSHRDSARKITENEASLFDAMIN